MAHGLDCISLVVFTTLSPSGMVAFIFISVLRIRTCNHNEQKTLDALLGIPFFLVLSGLIVATTHLGTPANALFVVFGIGRSPLSNEVVVVVLFLVLAGSYWMTSLRKTVRSGVAKVYLGFASMAATFALVLMAFSYSIDTLPTWNTIYTPWMAIASAFGPGSLLAGFIASLAGMLSQRRIRYFLLCHGASALAVGQALYFFKMQLQQISTFHIDAADFVSQFHSLAMIYPMSAVLSILLAALPLFMRIESPKRRHGLFAAAVLVSFLSLFLLRIVFYRLYMTVGI